ncbi:phage portal protein [Nitrospira sp. Nam74]
MTGLRERRVPPPSKLAKLQSWVDRGIEVLSPMWGLQRQRARTTLQLLSAYRGATKDRLHSAWSPYGGSADADLLPELADLRERSRELNRNDAFAAAITDTVVANVIGTGLRPQAHIDRTVVTIADDLALQFEQQCERAWQRWIPHADAQNRLDFYDIQSLVYRQILENGEVIILPLMVVDDPSRPYSLALEIIEADRLATPSDLVSDRSVREGVKLGSRGEPIGYYIRKAHPGDVDGALITNDTQEAFNYYPAFNTVSGRPNIYHLYRQKRPGQTRGEPFFAPVLAQFKDLGDYLEAEIVSARVGACFSAFITKNDPYAAAAGATDSQNTRGQRISSLEPGIIDYLAPGEKVEFASPNRPGGTFEPFTMVVLRSIGAALGLPLELVTKDFSKTNYSSARAAMLEARRFFKNAQQWLGTTLCQPVWEMVIYEAWLREDIPALNIFSDLEADYLAARWIAPGWGWVDPVKEVDSSINSIKSGLSTLAEECAAQGRDWEEVAEQRAREQTKYKHLGLDEPTKAEAKPGAEGQPAPEETDPESEPESEPTDDQSEPKGAPTNVG